MNKLIILSLIILTASCQKNSSSAPSAKSDSPASLSARNDDDAKISFIKIGTQKWMAANLSVIHYRNGDRIPQIKNASDWGHATSGAWCWYNNDSATYAVYGRMYNWYAVNDPRGLAPTGWHVPSVVEWDTLANHLGLNVGGKMKETGLTHWSSPNKKATNSTGFTGLPGGWRHDAGYFSAINLGGNFWSSTPATKVNIPYRDLIWNTGALNKDSATAAFGMNVRCIKD